MAAMQNHKIHTANLQVNFEGMEEGLGVHESLGLFFYEKIKPALEKAFDQYSDQKRILVIDKLELDCGNIPYENWERVLLQKILSQVGEELKSPQKSNSESVSLEKKADKVFFFFLQKGYFPWNSPFETPKELEKAIVFDISYMESFKKISQKSPAALDRLFLSFSFSFISKVFETLTKISNPKVTALVYNLQTNPILQKELMQVLLYPFPNQSHSSIGSFLKTFIGKLSNENLSFLAEYLSREPVPEKDLKEVLKSLLSEPSPPDFRGKISYLMEIMVTKDPLVLRKNGISQKEIDFENMGSLQKDVEHYSKSMDRKNFNKSIQSGNHLENTGDLKRPNPSSHQSGSKDQLDSEIGDEIFVENAGLVLLHPFLTGLFSNLQLTENGKFVAGSDQSFASRVLQYLVFGENDLTENFYPLNKILCGMEVSQVLGEEVEISQDFKTECEDLLQAVIGHWPVLKNTSMDGLRETFLQRPGKISRIDKGWKLQVEGKTVDVLLAKLPWGLGIIKLPWMNEMMFVDWN